ncbi:hypothetical protein DM813_04725 [Pseudomonas alkylphenolica]|uniref:DUF2931 family protein n=1 Tax=Pseudomonas alkylphenolica TaxID=237609 RepID=A0A443ZVQ4_9PSED|nr:DUF2931 family protein [Pseudomonas alkylphenolica]RWU25037.1 hypothetical protein DM813_04725 [Pseudomonas alkylphenolica]
MNSCTRFGVLALALISARAWAQLPYDAWHLSFGAPDYMEAWIETANVVDVRNRVFLRAMSGNVSIHTPENSKGDPRGWPSVVSWGGGKYVSGAQLPQSIYVRWESYADSRTYEVLVTLNDEQRQAMVKGEKAYCAWRDTWITGFRKGVVVELAPGGIAKAWLAGPCVTNIEIGRFVGKVVKAGPDAGQPSPRLRPESRTYIERYGIPYDSW